MAITPERGLRQVEPLSMRARGWMVMRFSSSASQFKILVPRS